MTQPVRTGPARSRRRTDFAGSGERDRGSLSVFVVIFSVAVFLLAGLLVDGGAAINARLKAADIAEQAARAAADQVDTELLRATGRVRLVADESVVCGKAESIVSKHDVEGAQMTGCVIGGAQDEVTIGVSAPWEAFFLSALGFNGSDMQASATAGPDEGNG